MLASGEPMNNRQEHPAQRADIKLILPTVLAVALFIISIFAIFLPAFRSNIMDRKREMIRELTHSAWSVLLEYAEAEKKGNLSREDAQKGAAAAIRYLRYGQERKDYFWITDMHPLMVMHPYRPQLEGKDLSGPPGEDPTGKKLFVEMVKVCRKQGSGYVEYMWQWKDDAQRIVPKLSYVKHFEPWDWIIGTGIYIEDVKLEIAGMTGRLITVSIVIILVVAMLLFYMTRQSLLIEKRRQSAEHSLREFERKKTEESRKKLIVQLQATQLFFNQPIKHFLKEAPRCPGDISIREAAALMSKNHYSAILVTAEGDAEGFTGIVTDRDLRVRVLAEGIDTDLPVDRVISSPLISIPDSALIFEAMLLMQEKSVRHLAVKDHDGRVISLISDQQLLHMQRNSSAYLIKEIHEARRVEDIVFAHQRLPQLAGALIGGGVNSKNICRIFTTVSDAIVERLITFAQEQLGPPPAAFAFIALGSEGREEQTLKTDQDNALIYDDMIHDDIHDTAPGKQAREYFLELGQTVNRWLDQCGYKLCEGDIMAGNPKWCQPLSGWKKHFHGWLLAAAPQDLLEVNIFFDFRCVYGDKEFTAKLREYIGGLLDQQPAFFQFMARNALLYKPPIGFFGNIVTGSSGNHRSTFDIKDAMRPIVNFARLYALKHHIEDTNTQERLYRLFTGNVLTKSSYEEMVKVYDYLMQMRFKHQAAAIDENREPDNFINPKQLTEIEYTLLKNAFTGINHFQKRLSYDFTGTA
jgi:signal-transduction protein with cAMP-binding, CBS, and nucleotidyltransferase domain